MKVKKKQHSFEIVIFCNDINVFTVSFDQFNAFLLNKTIILKILTPNFWTMCITYIFSSSSSDMNIKYKLN